VKDCAEVRELLPEHVLGTLDPAERARVDAHLAWCAGCRKEAGELAEGAVALALGLPAVDLPPDLEDRVVASIRGRRVAQARRRRIGPIAVGVAAVVASASIGWGIGLAGRARPPDPGRSARDATQALENFQDFLVYVGGGGTVETASLRPVGGGAAGGRATLYDSAEEEGDFLVVVVGGLPASRGPYTVMLRSGGATMVAGNLEQLEAGQMGAIRQFAAQVSGFDAVVVEDATGRRVLAGTFQG
jgi:hypothetical protein